MLLLDIYGWAYEEYEGPKSPWKKTSVRDDLWCKDGKTLLITDEPIRTDHPVLCLMRRDVKGVGDFYRLIEVERIPACMEWIESHAVNGVVGIETIGPAKGEPGYEEAKNLLDRILANI